MKRSLRVIDFFCGAGGFSEGFRQQGFDVVMGIDNWLPAIETHNINHNLKDKTKNILDFYSSVDEIESLPDTEVIVGSPPCVLFSLSNKGGKADKALGIKLIESFLRVIAIKKHQPSSRLVAWFMENVPNSKNYIKPQYTFQQLNLEAWAKDHKINPDKIALNASANGNILNTAFFGTSQKRERFVCGEIVTSGKFPDLSSFIKKEYRSIGKIKKEMPPPNLGKSKKLYIDPNYRSLRLRADQITDHFYDSGIYKIQWKAAQESKINHPYMGKMSFPEGDNNPSRTIMATRSKSTREALIYKSEYKRQGDGEYRLPTIREIATLMGFPYSYQFSGGESTKWRQIGNAISPPMSAALAKGVRLSMGLTIIPDSKIIFSDLEDRALEVKNLNTFSELKFDNPPKRKPNARFRRHPFKEGNMTVALTNFDPNISSNSPITSIKWYSSVYMGTGDNFILKTFPKNEYKHIAKLIQFHHKTLGEKFIREFDNKFKKVIGNTDKLQKAYVGMTDHAYFEPGRLIEEISNFILNYELDSKYMEIAELIPGKQLIPTKQVYAMYAINRIIS